MSSYKKKKHGSNGTGTVSKKRLVIVIIVILVVIYVLYKNRHKWMSYTINIPMPFGISKAPSTNGTNSVAEDMFT